MPTDDGWDWRWIYYTGTKILGMSEQTFWKSSPRKLAALSAAYVEEQNAKYGDNKNNSSGKPKAIPGYIDQLF